MQTRFFLNMMVGLALLVTVAGCQRRVVVARPVSSSSSAVKGMPPGHTKKLYGHQSARAFAPGQQKKQATTVVIVNGNDTGNQKKAGKKKK